MARIERVRTHDGKHYGVRFFCPGCKDDHTITTLPYPNGWTMAGDDERPTFSPSILVHEVVTTDGRKLSPHCHSFVRDGRIEFLGDCTHALAGQTVELPSWPVDGSKEGT